MMNRMVKFRVYYRGKPFPHYWNICWYVNYTYYGGELYDEGFSE